MFVSRIFLKLLNLLMINSIKMSLLASVLNRNSNPYFLWHFFNIQSITTYWMKFEKIFRSNHHSTIRSLIHLKTSHVVKINYIHEILLSEWNTCLPNLVISHLKRQLNIPQNQASLYLNIARDYLSVLKTEE